MVAPEEAFHVKVTLVPLIVAPLVGEDKIGIGGMEGVPLVKVQSAVPELQPELLPAATAHLYWVPLLGNPDAE